MDVFIIYCSNFGGTLFAIYLSAQIVNFFSGPHGGAIAHD